MQQSESLLEASEQEELQTLSGQIWTFFEDYVTEKENWLPPDNVQLEPPNGIAHRTSPTNIGLLQLATVSAHDLGYLGLLEFIERQELTFATMAKLGRYQ